jgi:UDP-N-acetylmuramate--alanine ligase
MDQFATAFEHADSLFILDIYAASEQPIEGVTSKVLANTIREKGNAAVSYARSFDDAATAVATVAQPGDMILTLGAGSISQLGPIILEKLNANKGSPQFV